MIVDLQRESSGKIGAAKVAYGEGDVGAPRPRRGSERTARSRHCSSRTPEAMRMIVRVIGKTGERRAKRLNGGAEMKER